MATAAIFEVFDHPLTVTKEELTAGYTDSSGNWISEIVTETEIAAHVSDLSLKELSFIDAGIVAVGVRKLTCEVSLGLIPGGRINITELDTTTSEWLIVQKMHSSGLLSKHMEVQRDTFLLKRRT